MNVRTFIRSLLAGATIFGVLSASAALAADITGQLMGGGAPIAQATVILMQASAGEPKQLTQMKTDGNCYFAVHGTGAPGSSLYLVASGGIPKQTVPSTRATRRKCSR